METSEGTAAYETTPGSSPSEIGAWNAVISALNPLDSETRARLLQSVITFLSIPIGVAPSGHAQVAKGTPAFSHGASSIPDRKTGGFSEDRTLSVKSFLFDKTPQTDIERVACLAYYLTHYLGTPHFKTLDISKLNTEGAQLKFSNAAKAVDNATRAGLLVPSTKGQKQLSAIGERYVQALPDKVAAKEALARARPRRSKTKRSDSQEAGGEE
jgi:hypothetical protein